MQTLRLAVTCVGGNMIADVMAALRDASDYRIWILGLDFNVAAPGRVLCDAFTAVPSADIDPDAWRAVMADEIARHRLDGVVLLSDPETRAAGPLRNLPGVRFSCAANDVVATVTDKLALLTRLKAAGMRTGPFCAVTADSLASLAHEMGYPARKLIVKARNGRGSRGIYVIDPNVTGTQSNGVPGRDCLTGDLSSVAALIGSGSHYLTPYYDGPVYDVDCIANAGTVVDTAARLRQWANPFAPMSMGHRIEMDPEVLRYVADAVRALGVDGAFDADVVITEDGPVIMDASCRLSGSTGITWRAGKNFPAGLVRHMLGLPPVLTPIRDGAVFRTMMTQVEIDPSRQHIVF